MTTTAKLSDQRREIIARWYAKVDTVDGEPVNEDMIIQWVRGVAWRLFDFFRLNHKPNPKRSRALFYSPRRRLAKLLVSYV